MGKAGAPTKYREKYCQEIVEYFSKPAYEEREKQVVTKEGVCTILVMEATDFPSFAGFCCQIRVSKVTLLEWCKKHKEFKEAYELCKVFQENFLLVNGNKGLIDKSFGIFTAKNTIGYRDRFDDEKDNININVSLADKIAKARARVNKKKDN